MRLSIVFVLTSTESLLNFAEFTIETVQDVLFGKTFG